jgi:Mn-dependent DtxR family transcriptional regulator
MTINKDKDINASIDASNNKGDNVSKVSKLDKQIAEALASSIDKSNVLSFPAKATIKDIQSSMKRMNDSASADEATKGGELNAPLHKTLGITDLHGKNRKIASSTSKEAYNNEGGESSEQYASETETVYKEVEPPYYKVYIDTIARIQGIPHSIRAFVMALGKYMTYDGTLQITKSAKGKVAKELGVSEPTIANYLTKTIKTGLLINNGCGEYVFHPSVMGRGSWEDVKANRQDLYNHAVGIVRLDHSEKTNETIQKFQFLDLDTAKAVLEVMGADKEALNRAITGARSNKK